MLYDASDKFSNPRKASSRKPKTGGLYIGKVVRISGGIFVQVPRVASRQVFGPCIVFSAYPVLGQRVLCGFLDNKFDEVVILGRETTSKIVKDVDSPSANTDAANKLYVDTEILELKQYVDNNFD